MSSDWVALSLPFPVHTTTIPLGLAKASQLASASQYSRRPRTALPLVARPTSKQR
jgi:hypothetical protein